MSARRTGRTPGVGSLSESAAVNSDRRKRQVEREEAEETVVRLLADREALNDAVTRLRAENERLREALVDVLGAARVFNRNGMSWLEYDRLLAGYEVMAKRFGPSDENHETPEGGR